MRDFLHRLGSPRPLFEMTGAWLPWLWALTLSLMAVGLGWALLYAPPDYQQGHSVRIMYIHVPAALLAQTGYALMAAAGLVFLVWRIKLADMAVAAAAPLGASITFLALATGAIWGKPTWGSWWEWGDARLVSTLILLFLYLGVMALRAALAGQAGGASDSAGRASALLALLGLVNLPIIQYSVEWWHTLHQPSSFSLAAKPTMPVEMWAPLLVMALAYYGFYMTVWLMRIREETLRRELRTDWVQQWLRGARRHAV